LLPLRDVIARYGIVAHKRLGQNFLLDLNLTGRIARAAGRLDHATIIEIGSGPGGLTRALLSSGARRVIAIERDRRSAASAASLPRSTPSRGSKSSRPCARNRPGNARRAAPQIVATFLQHCHPPHRWISGSGI
jgi:hypothetical protein